MDQEIERREGETRPDPNGRERQLRRNCATLGFKWYKLTPNSDGELFISIPELLQPNSEPKTERSKGDAAKPKSSTGLTEEELDALLESDHDE